VRVGYSALGRALSVAKPFKTDSARALLAGAEATSFVRLEQAGSSSFGIPLIPAGHTTGWACANGGSIAIIRALAAHLQSLGGEITTNHSVRSMGDIPPSRAVIFDVTPRQLAEIAADELPPRYVRKLRRYRYGPGVFKADYALRGPIPWKADACRRAATVHVGGTIEEIASHERALWKGGSIDKPFVLVAQQSLFDPTRSPAGQHTAWVYCHVPHGSTADMSGAMEHQIERFAPGFRDLVLARHTMNSAQYEEYNANFVGGDIGGGANNLAQFIMRPFPNQDPYATPNPRLYLGSSSTPPGGGVHGMCGYWAARSALRRMFGRR